VANALLNSPFYRSAIQSMELAIELFKRGGIVECAFSVVLADHATTMLLLDRLKVLRTSIHDKYGHTLDFHTVLDRLMNNKGVKIPESAELTTNHSVRDGVLHHPTIVLKPEAKFYLSITYNFLKRFIKDEYRKNFPTRIKRSESLFDRNLSKIKLKKISLGRYLTRTQQKLNSPPAQFDQLFTHVEALINFLGYKLKILRKGASFTLNNVHRLNERGVVNKRELIKLEKAIRIREEMITGIIGSENEYTKINVFLESLVRKLSKYTKSTLAQHLDELDQNDLIELALISTKMTKKRNARKRRRND